MDEKTIARFWSKVDKDGPVPAHAPELGPCWVWTAGLNSSGYGKIKAASRYWGAHRLSWFLEHGQIPDGLCVLHKCDNRGCVRTAHLFVGTRVENAQDMMNKGRHVPAGMPGETHPMRKLNWSSVIQIRSTHAAGGISARALARLHGVNPSTIYDLLHRRTWRRV